MSAHLGSRHYPDHVGCKHCGAPIRVTNYALGPETEHYDPDAGFASTQRGTAWKNCRNGTVATPPDRLEHPPRISPGGLRLDGINQQDLQG